MGEAGGASNRGSGPRIYVGGIPTAISETMVRNHFMQWGQVIRPPFTEPPAEDWHHGMQQDKKRSNVTQVAVSGRCDHLSATNVIDVWHVAVQVVDVYFPKDKYLNRRKNFCFVTFATQQVRLSSRLIPSPIYRHPDPPQNYDYSLCMYLVNIA